MSARAAACPICQVHAESVFRIEGMDCHEEVAILERRLKHLSGLEALSADVIGQRLRVTYDAARLTTSAISDAVADTGMRAWLEHEQPHLRATTARRLRLVILAGAALAIGLVLQWTGHPIASAVALIAATVMAGIHPARRAFAAFRTRSLDINVLMTIAVVGACLIGEWAEAATVVFLFALAQYLESRSMDRARNAIRALMDLTPLEGVVVSGLTERRVRVDDVQLGDTLRVRPGDKVPLDGVVVAGTSDVNQAPITGESMPADKAAGDEVFAGSINGHGTLDVRVTRLRRDTTLARIIHLVEDAQAQRAPSQTLVDRFARLYTPAVIALAVVVALAPPLLLAHSWIDSFYRALVLLVIACPCALVISTPVSIVSALAAGARRGVLMKGGIHLERLAGVRTIAYDKTGTLTKGHPKVTAVDSFDGLGPDGLLAVAAALESRSQHPIARAIASEAHARGIRTPDVAGFRAVHGMGAEGVVDGRPAVIGNARLMAERGMTIPPADGNGASGTAVFVASDGQVRGSILVSDQVREVAGDVIGLVEAQGVRTQVMLTGDNVRTAEAIARQVGVAEYHANLLPEAKVEVIRELQERGGPVAMVGDGVNDAPALAVADVGIVMGAAGSDAALETADVALMGDDLSKIPYALRLSRATMRNIRTNIAVALGLKFLFLALAVTGYATLWMAILADTGASLLVIGNGLRLLRTT
jgi:Cd2+/Zn2+-exporting ATPase